MKAAIALLIMCYGLLLAGILVTVVVGFRGGASIGAIFGGLGASLGATAYFLRTRHRDNR